MDVYTLDEVIPMTSEDIKKFRGSVYTLTLPTSSDAEG